MKIPKKYRNDSIPPNNSNRPATKSIDKLLIVPCGDTIEYFLYSSGKTNLMNIYRRKSLNQKPIHVYGTDTLMKSGIHHLNTDRGDLKSYMDQYGKFVGSDEYLPNYTAVVKYVAWSLDLHTPTTYTWRIKPKKSQQWSRPS